MALYAYNAASQDVATGGTVALASSVRCGCGASVADGGVRLNVGGGWYRVDVSVTGTLDAAGDVEVSAQVDGVDVPGATASETVAAAGDYASLSMTFLVHAGGCCCNSRPLVTVVNAGAEATFVNAMVTVTRVG